MTVYDYPGDYQAETDLVGQARQRIERVSALLAKLKSEWDGIDVEAAGGDGDVTMSVNHKGRLVSLTLAMGVTARYSAAAFEDLFNDTLEAAGTAATEEVDAVTGEVDDATLQSALHDFADADNPVLAD